jgi:5-formyltetrahydrofolate cyclo-ligase
MPDLSIPDQKAKLREKALARRDALDPDFRAQASLALAKRAVAIAELEGLEPISGFWPIRSEIDVRPLLEALHARGQRLCLPVLARPAMIFRLWKPGDALVLKGFGVSEPPPAAPEVAPLAMLVPLAAFDRRGGRLGYGKGHFDTAIAAVCGHHRVLTLGVAFSVQEVPTVPLEPHDRRLDMILTESELIRTPTTS